MWGHTLAQVQFQVQTKREVLRGSLTSLSTVTSALDPSRLSSCHIPTWLILLHPILFSLSHYNGTGSHMIVQVIEDQMERQWSLPFRKIVHSRAVRDPVRCAGNAPHLLDNMSGHIQLGLRKF